MLRSDAKASSKSSILSVKAETARARGFCTGPDICRGLGRRGGGGGGEGLGVGVFFFFGVGFCPRAALSVSSRRCWRKSKASKLAESVANATIVGEGARIRQLVRGYSQIRGWCLGGVFLSLFGFFHLGYPHAICIGSVPPLQSGRTAGD